METQAILNSYWVIPNRLMAGEYPASYAEDRARRRLRWLLEQGVTAWLDLTEDGELGLLPYTSLLEEEAARMGKPVRHIRLAIPDFTTPEPEHMARILHTLDELLAEAQTVYLHCFGGIGRTGTTVGCYLVHRGLSGEAALAQIAAWRKDTPSGCTPSPETEQQRQLILNWKD